MLNTLLSLMSNWKYMETKKDPPDVYVGVEEKSLRFNEGKTEWSLVDFKSIESLPKVLAFGAKKYSRNNWKKGLDLDQILDSASRHLFALMSGEINDPESGLPHAGHILCNIMFYEFHRNKQNSVDGSEEEGNKENITV